MRPIRPILLPLSIVPVLVLCAPAPADVVRMTGGGEVHGALEKAADSDASANGQAADVVDADVAIVTLSGARVVIRKPNVAEIERRPLAVETYERRARTVPDDVDARWELAEWCRTRGLKTQREEQLERILELDPDHEKAHYGLGHSRLNGQWTSRDELLRERGFVQYKGRYVSAQEMELLRQADAARDAELEWFKKVRLWHTWLNARDAERSRQGLAELTNIHDPNAIPALANFLKGDRHENVRQLYVRILTKLPGATPVPALVEASLYDTSREIRALALEAITPDRRQAARSLYVRELRNPANEIVVRAASALKDVGDAGTVLSLIDALITTHRYQVRVTDRSSTYSFGTDGSFGNPYAANLPPEIAAGLRAGQYPNGVIIDNSNQLPPPTRLVTVQRQQQNPEVLAALEHLTGQSLGYDENAWRLWWSAQKSGTVKPTPVP